MTVESLQPFLQWVTEHPNWSGFIVFLISLSESLAVVGLVIPGVILMTAIGSLIGAGRLPGLETMTWAMLGAVVGDGLSYWLGHHYRYKLKYLWPFKKFPNWLDSGTLFFKIHGGKSIILGRFVGPIRPTIPVIAGIMGMTPRIFLFFNIISAVAWAPLYCLPGILIGASLGQFSPKVASTVLSLILGILFVLWLIFYLLLKIVFYCSQNLSYFFRKTWIYWQRSKKLSRLQSVFTTAKHPHKGQLGTIFIFLIAIIIFGFVFTCVNNETGIVVWNDPVYQCLRSLYTTTMANWSIIAISFGEPWILLSIVIIVGVWGFPRQQKAAIICWLCTILIGFAIGQYFKTFIYILRPEGLVQPPMNYSFPSNHTLLATLVYGWIAAFARQRLPHNYRWIAWTTALFVIALVAFCGVYLGLHWFTDTIGGFALGITCVSLGIFIYRRFVPVDVPVQRLLIVGSISLIIFITGYNFHTYKNNQMHWQRQWNTQILEVNRWWEGQPTLAALYRSSMLKHHILPFDFNWLGDLQSITKTLYVNGWEPLPQLTFESSLMFLMKDPSPKLIPVFPRFHRDRLPSLVIAKISNKNAHRIVLQLWASDFITTDGIPLWVGTIRIENIKNKIPFFTFYLENTTQSKSCVFMRQFLASITGTWKYKKVQSPCSLFLIMPKNQYFMKNRQSK